MRVERSVDLGTRTVLVRELTVGEIRQWLRDVETSAATIDPVGAALLEDVTLSDLPRFTDLQGPADTDALTQSELRTLVAAIKDLNPDFFLLRGRLIVIGKALEKPA